MSGFPKKGEQRARAIVRLLFNEGISRRHGQVSDSKITVEHHKEYVQAREVWNELGALRFEHDYSTLLGRPTLRERLVTVWHLIAAFGGKPAYRRSFVAASCTAVALFAFGIFDPRTEHLATRYAETREFALDDGSRIVLGPKSELLVNFTDGGRNVEMTPGEAFFEISHDPGRPFVIAAGEAHIKVVGTKFNVKYDASGIRVSVVEGLVQVEPPKSSFYGEAEALNVPAGKEAIVKHNAQVAIVDSATLLESDYLVRGQRDYDNVPLEIIVSDVNRYLSEQVRIESPRLAEMRLTASFHADQADQFIKSLPDVIPVLIERREGNRIVLSERHPVQTPPQ